MTSMNQVKYPMHYGIRWRVVKTPGIQYTIEQDEEQLKCELSSVDKDEEKLRRELLSTQ